MTYLNTIFSAAKFVGVSGHLLAAICFQESNFRNVTVQDDGNSPSIGICQMKLGTAMHMDDVYNHKTKATIERLNDPYINAFYAAKYLKYQLAQNDDDVKLAVDAYNRGHSENRNSRYVRKIAKASKALFPDYESELTKPSIQIRNHINRKVN